MATQVAIQTGLVITPAVINADVTGNYIVPGSVKRVTLRFVNGAGVTQTVTLDDVITGSPESATQFNPDVAIAIPAAGVRYVVLSGDRLARFLNKTNGRVSWTYSAVVTLTLEATGS